MSGSLFHADNVPPDRWLLEFFADPIEGMSKKSKTQKLDNLNSGPKVQKVHPPYKGGLLGQDILDTHESQTHAMPAASTPERTYPPLTKSCTNWRARLFRLLLAVVTSPGTIAAIASSTAMH